MKRIWFAASIVLISNLAFSTTITGKVSNKTSNKPASGDEVVLLKLAASMEEETRTKTDSKGQFTLDSKSDDGSTPHLVQVTHQGVNYFRPAPPGTNSVEVEVYDAAKEVPGITGVADIIRVQADSSRMDLIEMWVVKNASTPPRTKMSDRTFEITLPKGAEIDSAVAAGPGGMPVSSAPVPTGEEGHYGFIFPVRPGETRFQVAYHLPYSGSFAFTRQPALPTGDVVVLLPKSVDFKSNGNQFQASNDEKGMNVYVAKNVSAGEKLAFSIAGTGAIPREAQPGEGDQSVDGNSASSDSNRPGGGLGTPIDAPDPLHKYRWWLLGGLAAALVAGAFYIMARPSSVPDQSAAAITAGNTGPAMNRALHGSSLDALKEELFQLESERLEGRISQTDYEQVKSALDLILKRAISRQSRVAKS